MKSNQLIALIVIVVALAGAGVFAYFAFTGTEQVTVQPSSSINALPHGTTLNFNTVEKFNKNAKVFEYPRVSADETGLPLNQLIQE